VGLVEDDRERKPVIKYKPINEKQRKEIDYHSSLHVREMQRSCCIKIDDDVLDPARCDPTTQNHNKADDPEVYSQISNTGYLQKLSNGQANQRQVNVKYMNPQVVNMNRQTTLTFKQRFLLRQAYMKSLGQKQLLMQKLERWLMANIDQIYESFASEDGKKEGSVLLSERENTEQEDRADNMVSTSKLASPRIASPGPAAPTQNDGLHKLSRNQNLGT